MLERLRDKVAEIRMQPEHIRMRYTLLCLVVSMIFVLGIWIVSLQESFRTLGHANVPEAKAIFPSDQLPSLQSLMDKAEPLKLGTPDQKTGQDYFNEMYQNKPAQPQGEGTTPDNQPATP